MMRSTVVNGDATLGSTGSAPFAVEILRASLSDGFRMTRPSVGATIKKGWREDESSGKLHTSSHPWAQAMRFPGAEPRPSAPQAKAPTFLHRGVKWQTTEKDCWQRRYRKLKRTTARARSCAWAAAIFWCPLVSSPADASRLTRRWGLAVFRVGA